MSLIAYCGLDCKECPAYQATQDNDQTIREKVAVDWSKEFNADITADDINCDGCQSVEISVTRLQRAGVSLCVGPRYYLLLVFDEFYIG